MNLWEKLKQWKETMTEKKERARSGPKGRKYWEEQMKLAVLNKENEMNAQFEAERQAMLAEYGDLTPGIPADPNVAAELKYIGEASPITAAPAAYTPAPVVTSPLDAFKTVENMPKEDDSLNLFKKLFYVTGRVRLTPRVGEPVVAEQSRLVWARNDEQAVEKFGKYFQKLSDANGNYQVLGATVTEAIS